MRIDKESHRANLLALLTNPGLTITGEGETLESAARTYIEVLDAVRSAKIGCDCEAIRNAQSEGGNG